MHCTTKKPHTADWALKTTAGALALAGLLSLPTLARAQAAPVFFEVEGGVTAIEAVRDGAGQLTGVDVTMFGRKFRVPPTANIHTPSATLSIEQLADPTSLPGRVEEGFVSGTGILIGEVGMAADGTAEPAIHDVAIEPAETVLIGLITANGASGLTLLDVPLREITDARMPSEGYMNDFGFQILPGSLTAGTFAAAEGYFAPDGNFWHYIVTASGGTLSAPDTPQSSILRARCDQGGRLEVQGASYLPANAVVEFYNPNSGFYFGSIVTTVDPATPDFGSYRFRTDVNDGPVNSDAACPSEVLAKNLSNGTEVVAAVDGVVAPPAPADLPAENVAPVAANDVATVFIGLATELHLTANDTDANGNLDPTTVQLGALPPELSVINLGNGDVMVTATTTGTFVFTYTVSDQEQAVSNTANVTIDAQPAAQATVGVDRANYRVSRDRWEARGSTNVAGAVVTLKLVRTGQTIGTATADATGAWKVDVRGTGVTAVTGDIVEATTDAGGSAQQTVTVEN